MDDSTTTNSMSSSTTGGPINIGPVVQSANIISPSSAKPAFKVTKWLHYVKETDKALCFTCSSALAEKLIIEDRTRADDTYVRRF